MYPLATLGGLFNCTSIVTRIHLLAPIRVTTRIRNVKYSLPSNETKITPTNGNTEIRVASDGFLRAEVVGSRNVRVNWGHLNISNPRSRGLRPSTQDVLLTFASSTLSPHQPRTETVETICFIPTRAPGRV